MRKKTLLILTAVITLSLSMLVGCGNQQETNNTITEQPTTTEAPTSTPTPSETPTPTPTETPTPTPTETPHEHAYTESTTKEATCTEAGEKSFTCNCGDTYTEAIEATGHKYGDYVYNNDATYEADGTETATCVCGLTDTRTASGTKLELPKEPNMHGLAFEDWVPKATQYCMENTNVYFEPSFQGPVIGTLSINDVVKITGNSTNYEAKYNYPPYNKTESPMDIQWVRINYNGQVGYIPDKYTWKSKRDTSIALNPLAANYPTLDGGSGLFAPANDGKLYYVYGACEPCTVKLNPECKSLRIYDANLNLIAEVTDQNVSFVMSGNAYCSWETENHYDWRYEINYNGTTAYVNSLDGTYQ